MAGTFVANAVTFSESVVNLMSAVALGLSVEAMGIIGQINGKGSCAESRRTTTHIVDAGSLMGLLSPSVIMLGMAGIGSCG